MNLSKDQVLRPILAGMLAMLVLFSSCRKDEETSATELTVRQKLIGNWLFTGMLVDPPIQTPSGLTSNYFNTLDECYRDDFFTFESNNQFTFHLNETPCYNQQIESTGTWVLNSDQSRLILTDHSGSGSTDMFYDYYIAKLTSKRLELHYQLQDTAITYTYIYTRK